MNLFLSQDHLAHRALLANSLGDRRQITTLSPPMKLPQKNKTDSSPRQVIQTPSDADGVKGGGIYG